MPSAAQNDLFNWQEIASLYARRQELVNQIKSQKVNSHRRVVLQDRLMDLNIKILRLETK